MDAETAASIAASMPSPEWNVRARTLSIETEASEEISTLAGELDPSDIVHLLADHYREEGDDFHDSVVAVLWDAVGKIRELEKENAASVAAEIANETDIPW